MNPFEDIVCAPDVRLKSECDPIDDINDDIRVLADRMLEDMYATGGCGLAAPQVGVLKQIVVIDVNYTDETDRDPYVLINPQVITADGPEVPYNEGCLSYPGISVEVMRPSHVVVQARNLDGDLMRYEASENLLAVCLQHEIDHLHGITMVDHLGPLKRAAAMREYEQAKAEGARPGETSVE